MRFYWKESLDDLAAVTGLQDGDRGIVPAANGVAFYEYDSATTAWVPLATALPVVTSVGSPGSDVAIPTEAAVRTAFASLNADNLLSGTLPAGRFNDTAHGNRSGGTLHANASAGAAGFMSASDCSKLAGIESGATADMSASEILSALLTVDGAASGLDADKLDGLDSADLLKIATAQTITAIHTMAPTSGSDALLLGEYGNVIGRNDDDSYVRLRGGSSVNNGAYTQVFGRDHATSPGIAQIMIGGYDATGYFNIGHRLTDNSSVILFKIDPVANVWIGTPIAAGSETRTLKMQRGTAPASAGTDRFAMYGKDIGAGKCAPHFLTEDLKEIGLYPGPAISDATDAATVITACNSILSYMRARGFIAS
jgi:hypothetical protein